MPRSRGLSIRWLVALIVVIPVVVASVLLVTVSVITGRRVSENLGAEVVAGGTARVSEEIRTYLRSAMRVCDLYSLRNARGELSTANLQSWEPALYQDLLTTPDVASICFAN